MENVLIETLASIAANVVVTLVGILSAYLIAELGKHEKMRNVSSAVDELTQAAETTVWELQQLVVDDLKEASEDGKLTRDEIRDLGSRLLSGTLSKMSASSINVLKAANVDINAIVTGAGEALIARIKHGDV